MKKIVTEETFKNAKTEEQYLSIAEEVYQKVLYFLSGAISPTTLSDEPYLCAALEAYAEVLKRRMAERELKIYERVKEFGGHGVEIPRRKEQ